jgi:hypothetical protein
MVEPGIASKCGVKVKLGKGGEIVEHSDKAFGLPVQYLIQRPDKLMELFQYLYNKGWTTSEW